VATYAALSGIVNLSSLKHSLPMKIASTFMTLATIAMLSGCGSKSTETTDTTEFADSTNEAGADSTAADSASAVAEDDAEFAVAAANGGMAEVALSKIAQDKATDPKVKQFAKQMITDHSKANEELKTLAKSKNITLPSAPNEEKQKAAADLGGKSGSDFDKAYISQMNKDHQETVKLFEDAQKEVKDTELKAFINKTLPVIKAHAEHVKSLDKTK
jgi:putative membrane protein